MPPGFIVENVIDQSVIVQSGFRRDIESLVLLMRVFCLCLGHASPYVSWLADNQNSISIAMAGDAARLERAGTTDGVATRGSKRSLLSNHYVFVHNCLLAYVSLR